MAIGSDADRAPGARPRPATSLKADQLGTSLREIAASVGSPEDALEPMLRAVVEATSAMAGAVCLYDVRQRLLRLAAEAGLSDEGCRRLRVIRKGEADAWEMPLHGLMNGRAYLIDNAAQNRFVPPLVEEATEMSSVVCLPLYSDQKPLASIILVARKPRGFEERDLHAVEAPLQEMARMIEATRRHAEGREHATPPTPASPAPIAPPVAAPGSTAAEAARLAATLARVERERDRLAAALDAAQGGDGSRLADLRGEIDRLRARLGEAEAEAAHERSAREELATRSAGSASAGRQELQRAQSAVREAENARAAALAEAARLRTELERARLEVGAVPTASAGTDGRVLELLAEVDKLRAGLAEAEAGAAHEQRAREELEGRLAGGVHAGQNELRKAIATARDAERGRMAALAEAARLRSELEIVRIEAAPGPSGMTERDDRIGPLLAEIDRLRARLAEAEAGAAHEHRARDELETRIAQGITVSQQELRRALEAARSAEEARATSVAEMGRLRAELDRARTDAARAPGTKDDVDVRIVELATEIDRLRTRVAEAEAGAAHQHRAREELEARVAGGLSSGQQEIQKVVEAARQAEHERAAAVAEAARLGTELERVRLAATQSPEQIAQATARWAELTREIDRLHTRLAEAEAGAAHEHRAREAIETRLAETASGSHHDLQQALAAGRSAEEARLAAGADAARLEAELREARAELARLPELRSVADGRAAELATEVERLAARVTEAEAVAAQERRARAELESRLAAGAAHEEQARHHALAEARASATVTANAELARVTAELDAARAEAARSDGLTTALDAAEGARRELTAALEAASAERAELARTAHEREAAQVTAHAAELAALRARLVDAEATAAREQRARAALDAAASSDLGKREDDLRAALAATRVAEESRDQAVAELTTLRHELGAARGQNDGLVQELAHARTELERRGGEVRAACEARDAGTRLVDAARRRQEEVDARLVETERARDRAAATLADVRAQLERTHSEGEHLRETRATANAERDRMAAELEGAIAAKARFEEALDAALGEASAHKQLLDETLQRAQGLESRLSERDLELQTLREGRATDAAALTARIDAATGEADRLRDAQAAIGAERDRLAADLEGATAGKTHLERALQQALETARAREQVTMEEAEGAAARLAEREAAVLELSERLTTEIAAREARLATLVAEADTQRAAHATLGTERDRLAADLEGAAAGQAHLEQVLDQTLEESRARTEDLRAARAQMWETAAHLEETTASLVAHTEASAREITTLTERVQMLTTAAHDLRDAHAAGVSECDRLAADLEGVSAAKAHLEEAFKLALAESRTRDQDAIEHLEMARGQLWNSAARLAESEQRIVGMGEEHARETAAFSERVEGLEAEADRLREVEAAAGTERDRLAATLEGTVAAKAHLEEALKAALDTARAREREAAALLQETRSQAWTAAARLADTEVSLRALAEERAAELAASTASIESVRADAERRREAEAAATSERDQLAVELAGARAAHERLEQTLAESREREEQAAARVAEGERALAAQRTESERALETLRAEHERALETLRAEGEGVLETQRTESERALETLRVELAALAARPAPGASAGPRAATSAPSPPAAARPNVVGRSAPGPATTPANRGTPTPRAPVAVPAPPEPQSRVVAILDDEGSWNGIAAPSDDLVLLAPTEDAVRRLAPDWPGRVLVNLGTPGVMKALLALRAFGAPTRIFGFIANGKADRVLPLGPIEPAVRPIAPDAIVAALAVHAPAKGRVVTVGADVDALLSLRQALARQGTSVSLAWDGKQATDLFDMVHPHAVVADLGAPYDAGLVLARVALSMPVPAAVLIDGAADSAAALVMALNNPDVAAKLVSRTDVLSRYQRTASGPPKTAPPQPESPAESPRLQGVRR